MSALKRRVTYLLSDFKVTIAPRHHTPDAASTELLDIRQQDHQQGAKVNGTAPSEESGNETEDPV